MRDMQHDSLGCFPAIPDSQLVRMLGVLLTSVLGGVLVVFVRYTFEGLPRPHRFIVGVVKLRPDFDPTNAFVAFIYALRAAW